MDKDCNFAKPLIFTASLELYSVLCGSRYYWGMFTEDNITVHLQQDIAFPWGTGFVATYTAMVLPGVDAIGIPETAYIMYDFSNIQGNKTIARAAPRSHYSSHYDHDKIFSWQVIVEVNKVITFSIKSDVKYEVYDGPGPLSPKLHHAKQSSAFYLFLIQHSPELSLQYKSVMHTSFSIKQHVVLNSHPDRNIVYGYQVRREPTTLRISFLSIHTTELKPYERCSYAGGFFIFNVNGSIEVCGTTWKEEVLYHLADRTQKYDQQWLIFVILYGGYIEGTVILSVESNMKSCVFNSKDHAEPAAFYLHAGCNQFVYLIRHDYLHSQIFEHPRSGPIGLKVHTLPLMHTFYNFQLNITVSDSDILGFNKITYTRIVGTHAQLRYQNPKRFVLKEIQGYHFTTWRLVIIQLIREALCDYEHAFGGYLSLPGTQMVTLYPFDLRCKCGVDGHSQYNVDIASTGYNIHVALLFKSSCAPACHHGHIEFTEYNAQLDILIVHNFTSFPVYWSNIHTNNSVRIKMRVVDSCRSCPLWVIIAPGWRGKWNQYFHFSALTRDELKVHKIIHPTR